MKKRFLLWTAIAFALVMALALLGAALEPEVFTQPRTMKEG